MVRLYCIIIRSIYNHILFLINCTLWVNTGQMDLQEQTHQCSETVYQTFDQITTISQREDDTQTLIDILKPSLKPQSIEIFKHYFIKLKYHLKKISLQVNKLMISLSTNKQSFSDKYVLFSLIDIFDYEYEDLMSQVDEIRGLEIPLQYKNVMTKEVLLQIQKVFFEEIAEQAIVNSFIVGFLYQKLTSQEIGHLLSYNITKRIIRYDLQALLQSKVRKAAKNKKKKQRIRAKKKIEREEVEDKSEQIQQTKGQELSEQSIATIKMLNSTNIPKKRMKCYVEDDGEWLQRLQGIVGKQ